MTLELSVVGGRLACVQDLGRTRTRLGLSTNGALDQYAAAAANVLAGNPRANPLVEALLVGVEVEASREALIAVTGAPATLTVDGTPRPQWQPVVVPAGARIRVAGITGGTRTYLAVNGDWDVPRLAGSVAPDAGFGFGADLRPGHTIVVRNALRNLTNPWLGTPLFRLPPLAPPRPAEPVLDIMPGPDLDRVDGVREALTAAPFTVDPKSNYIGVRMRGELPGERPAGEILSHGVAVGAIELPPSDELILLQRGRSLTAGYPVVAVASRVSLDVAGQLLPGQSVRLRWRTVEQCTADHRRQLAALGAVETAMGSALAALRHTGAMVR